MQHRLRQGFAHEPPIEHVRHTLARHLDLQALLLGVTGVSLKSLAALALLGYECAERGEQLGENRRVFDELIQHTLYELLDTQIEVVPWVVMGRAPADDGTRDVIEQAPRRMLCATEQALVQHRHFQQRDLQASDQRLESVRHTAVIEHELKQHGDQIGHIFVCLF